MAAEPTRAPAPELGSAGVRSANAGFRVMGCQASVAVWVEPDSGLDPVALVDDAEGALRSLEVRWTRFSPDSELSRLNAAAGAPVMLPLDTYALVALACEAWERTGGRFDPTVLPALLAAGYDRSFEVLVHPASTSTIVGAGVSHPTPAPTSPPSVPGCADIALDDVLGAVTLPRGTTLDLGGIGKGRAADLVAARVMAAGARGAVVDVGGDVRVAGTGPDHDLWVVGVEAPFRDQELDLLVALEDGAVATSTTLRRRWSQGGAVQHHLIDPRTGRPSTSDVVSATVVAASAVWAEVAAKAALIAGAHDGADLVESLGLAGWLVRADGRRVRVGPIDRFLL